MSNVENVKDVTKQWVKDNFDLKEEAEMKERGIHRLVYGDILRGTHDFDEWIDYIKNFVEDMKNDRWNPPNEPVKTQILFDTVNNDMCGCCCGGEIELQVKISWTEEETEEETIKRIISREKQRIRRKDALAKNAERDKRQKQKQAERERKQLKRLLKKYPEEVSNE